MDLDEALDILSRPAWVDGRSDTAVINQITALPGYLPPAKTLIGVPDLDGARAVRPIDVFRGLAYATRVHFVHPDVYDTYSMWAWIRYLGIFDNNAQGQLVLSPEAVHVRGNQRRVASEELGIGFAKISGEDWLAAALGPGAVTFVDVDVVPSGGTIPFAGGKHRVRQVSTKRPDYFMMHTDPISGRTRVRVLESKGTSGFNNQLRQLGGAVHQLEGIHINGSAPTGLAVSTALADTGVVRVLAVDPPGEDADDLSYDVRPAVDGIDDGPETLLQTDPTRGVFEASLAQLADYAGASEAAVGWAPGYMSERLSSRPNEDVITLDTPAGTCVGRRAVFQVRGRSVSLFAGVAQELHSALISLDLERVLSTQAELVPIYESRREAMREVEEGRAASLGLDGTVLDIRVER